jgi:hypothetical protein
MAPVDHNLNIREKAKVTDLAGERGAGFGAKEGEQCGDRTDGQHQTDEKQDRAKDFVPPQVHEIENDEKEFHR